MRLNFAFVKVLLNKKSTSRYSGRAFFSGFILFKKEKLTSVGCYTSCIFFKKRNNQNLGHTTRERRFSGWKYVSDTSNAPRELLAVRNDDTVKS
jgi:hypothetical protein